MTQNSTAYRANNAYRSAAVTVPPLKATVMLFDGAITLLQKAQEAHERKQYEAGHDYLTRATAILRGLSHNINFDRGGQVAERLFQTYNALIMACLRAYGRPKSRESFRRIIAGLTELRDAWQFVLASATRLRSSAADSAVRR